MMLRSASGTASTATATRCSSYEIPLRAVRSDRCQDLSAEVAQEQDRRGGFRVALSGEPGRLLNAAITDGVGAGRGLGQSVTSFLHERSPQYAHASVLAAAGRLEIPVTVHVAVGTDIIHMHPAASGAAIGEGSLRDFRYFVANVSQLEHGVYLNCGSAVVLPEVFLKAVALVRNRGTQLRHLTTVN